MANYRLNESMESWIHREVYVRFGGELSKSRHSNMKMGVGSLAYVMNTVGNIFSGQVVGETAKTLSERFGKVLQKRQSISINRQDVSTSINTQMDALIPPSKISGLTQGMFVGSVSDNFNERIEQKIFHCEIVVDAEKVKREESAYKKIPVITNFTDEDGNDRMKETVQANYRRIKEEVKQIVQEELERIKNDPVLCKLLPDNETV